MQMPTNGEFWTLTVELGRFQGHPQAELELALPKACLDAF
jgi:hypothetical protein